ncbi:MAG: hypothetical protein AAF235_03920 [Planctomycetota bacterium]
MAQAHIQPARRHATTAARVAPSQRVNRITRSILMTLLAASVASTSAQLASPNRPAGASRVVAVFDFDAVPTTASRTPEGWVRAQDDPNVPRNRPGFPLWNQAHVDITAGAAFRGPGALRLPTRGGSTSLLLDPGVIGALPGAAYAVTAQLRTSGLRDARAVLAARYLDADSAPLPGTDRRTHPIVSENGWQRVVLQLPPRDDAAFIQLEALVLQPREFENAVVVENLQVWDADYTGAAWIDDLAVLQIPRLTLETEAISNIVTETEPPSVTVRVQDLAGEPLELSLVARDASGGIVAEQSTSIDSGTLSTTWQPVLPEFGWYRFEARIIASLGAIAAASLDLAWTPPLTAADRGTTPHMTSREFIAISPARAGEAGLKALPEFADRIGAGLCLVPLLASSPTENETTGRLTGPAPGDQAEPSGDPERARVSAVLATVRALAASGIDPGISIAAAPARVAATGSAGRDAVVRLLGSDTAAWGPSLEDALDRLGPLASTWHLGPPGPAPADQPPTASEIAAARDAVARLVAIPTIGVGVHPLAAVAPSVIAPGISTGIVVPPGSSPESIGQRVDRWFAALDEASPDANQLEASLPTLRFVVDTTDQTLDGLTPRARAVSAARSTLTAIAAATDAGLPPPIVELHDPWHIEDPRGENTPARVMPKPQAAAWRTLSDVMKHRRPIGSVVLTQGVRALLLARADSELNTRSSAIALWQDAARDDPSPLEFLLSTDPVIRTDLFGNTALVEPTEISAGGARAHPIILRDEPIYIEDVDLDLIRFQTSIALDPPLIVSRHARHLHEVIIENPWPVPIRGHAYIVEPGGLSTGRPRSQASWRITPRQSPFSTETLGVHRIPIDIRFSPTEEAGTKPFVLDVELEAGKPYGLVRVHREVELGLPGVEMELAYRRRAEPAGNAENPAGGRDVFVEARITNTGSEPLTAELRAQAPSYARDESIISDIAPGETAVRVFPFAGGAKRLGGRRVGVTLLLPDRQGRLTKAINLPVFADG